MKTFQNISTTVLIFIFLTLIGAGKASAQSVQKGNTLADIIPSDVKSIVEKSCVNCHSEPGKTLALSRVNLTKWDQYSVEKQAAKAKAMCYEISKDKMPPKKFRANFPESVLSSEEIKTICDWAQSLQSKK